MYLFTQNELLGGEISTGFYELKNENSTTELKIYPTEYLTNHVKKALDFDQVISLYDFELGVSIIENFLLLVTSSRVEVLQIAALPSSSNLEIKSVLKKSTKDIYGIEGVVFTSSAVPVLTGINSIEFAIARQEPGLKTFIQMLQI